MTNKRKNIIFDDYEKEILEAYESGKLEQSELDIDFQAIAENTVCELGLEYKLLQYSISNE